MEMDLGLEVFQLPGGELRFNPADPALLSRLEQLDQRLAEIDTTDLQELDRQAKAVLNWVLGPGNDVDKALGGISLLAIGKNGRPVLQNLLDALTPVFREGIVRCAEQY